MPLSSFWHSALSYILDQLEDPQNLGQIFRTSECAGVNKIILTQNKSVKLFFVSVDPERDTPEVIKDYLGTFENKFIGITGEKEKIFLLYKSWGIMSQKVFTENGEYNIDHSSPVILLKDGKYVAKISHRDDIKKTIKLIKKYL